MTAEIEALVARLKALANKRHAENVRVLTISDADIAAKAAAGLTALQAALTAAVARAAQCCMCGKLGLSTAEDGGPECELEDGRWVCSAECYDKASDATAALDRIKAEAELAGWKRARDEAAAKADPYTTVSDSKYGFGGAAGAIRALSPPADLAARTAKEAGK